MEFITEVGFDVVKEGAFGRLYDEMARRFMDQERGARFSETLMKAVIDASIWGED